MSDNQLSPKLTSDTQELLQELREEYAYFKRLAGQTAASAWRLGEKLFRIQEETPHGEFLPLISSEFPEWGYRTVYHFINIYKNFKFETVSNLDIGLKALYLLASPSTPELVRQEITERAQNGEPITYPTIRESIQIHKTVDPIIVYSGAKPAPRPVDEYTQLEREERAQDTYLDAALADESKPVCQKCGQVYDGPRCPDCHKPDPIPSPMAVHYSSETPEWYTPAHVIERVVKVLGEIDLDPCSNPGEPNVPARKHYTQEDDGLSKAWNGRVYMNPPYGREIKEWISYLITQFKKGNVSEAIALVPARTDTEWFRTLEAFPRCFVYGRLVFSGYDNSAPFPSMAVYLGNNGDLFKSVFRDLGGIYRLDE